MVVSTRNQELPGQLGKGRAWRVHEDTNSPGTVESTGQPPVKGLLGPLLIRRALRQTRGGGRGQRDRNQRPEAPSEAFRGMDPRKDGPLSQQRGKRCT